MAYLPMTQEVIKFMNNSFDKEDIISYQMLITLFGNLFANEEDFLKDPGDRMGLSHFVENFLRKNDFQTIVTIKDLNLVFNANSNYDIYDKELYKVFFTLIYEELSSNDPQISFKIKESIFHLIDLIEKSLNENNNDEIILHEEEKMQIDTNEEKTQINNNEENKQKEEEEKVIFNKTSDSFIIRNKNYLIEYIRAKKLLPYECSICGLTEWQNEPLKLELDSLDGVYSNTNLNNLRFLCPNCYSQVGYNN